MKTGKNDPRHGSINILEQTWKRVFWQAVQHAKGWQKRTVLPVIVTIPYTFKVVFLLMAKLNRLWLNGREKNFLKKK